MVIPHFLMTHEEISEYRIKLNNRIKAKEITFDIRTNDKCFPNFRITRVLERIGNTTRFKLIAILIDLDYLKQNKDDLLKDDGGIKNIEEKQSLYPEGYKPFYSEDILENVERAKKMRKI
jgi:hypothetical protein